MTKIFGEGTTNDDLLYSSSARTRSGIQTTCRIVQPPVSRGDLRTRQSDEQVRPLNSNYFNAMHYMPKQTQAAEVLYITPRSIYNTFLSLK